MDERRAIFESEWPTAKAELSQATATPDTWRVAYERLLKGRLEDRYLRPINSIKSNGGFIGEGFAILTIQCALIEFLAALRLGWNYEYGAEDGKDFKYSDSQAIYVDFIRRVEPFKAVFDTKKRAKNFYSEVRCGLVHEAQTKNGWKVRASNSTRVAIDFDQRVVNRDLLGDAIDAYLAQYALELSTSADLQSAFIRKFDYIHKHSMNQGERRPA